jgi:endonuclease/exonuclease/phosphatase family metal-dependent hydrolase
VRHLKLYLISLLLLGAVISGLSGCGTSEKSVAPVVVNPFAGATVGTDSTLEIVTWNLERFAKNGDDTVEAVIQAIVAMDADIIALQEIQSFASFRAVRERLVSWEGDRATSAGYDINLAFLYRVDGDLQVNSVYEILVDFSREFPRRPFVLEGTYRDVPIVVINNHLKCCGDGIINEVWNDEETRRRDASLMLDDFIRENYVGRKVFVVGDMNDLLTDIPSRNVFQNFLDAPDLYLFADMAVANGPGSGWSFPSFPSHLDHILITAPLFEDFQGPETLVTVVPLHTFLNNGLNAYDPLISDHLPVVIRLKL